MPSRVAAWYRGLALVVLNTIVVFVVVDAVLSFVFPQVGRRPDAGTTAAFLDRVTGAPETVRRLQPFFPDFTPDDLHLLARETLDTYARPLRYEPFTQFREHARRGRFVNVEPAGFRRGKEDAPWPPEHQALSVFVFGGSTTFGYGLPDDDTIPAQLEALLRARSRTPVHVYNFGRGYYFSSQERALFEKLIGEGRRPDIAVFVDGLNDFYNTTGEPQFTPELTRLMAEGVPTCGPRAFVDDLAIGRAATWIRDRFTARNPRAAPGAVPAARDAARERRHVRQVIRRYRTNQAMIEAVARELGVATAFVWQPVPSYRYPVPGHPPLGPHERSRVGYPVVARLVRRGRLGPDVVWCADVQEGATESLYLDAVHYTPVMAGRVAGCIADGLVAHALVPRRTG